MGPLAMSVNASSCYHGNSDDGETIVDKAKTNGNFSTLLAAVHAAGLEDALRGDGPFTLFAPTDTAFAALPDGTMEDLLKPENIDQLKAILTYHVVPTSMMSGQIMTGDNLLRTIKGNTLIVAKEYGDVTVGTAQVIATDIKASNGVIHVIDRVLLPKM
ncbi:MAG: fasciclin domain-containing protein [Proteobacteria bacterium]|nr:fasciclin domain-containing protein [Pseudomonadota bacterium]